MFSGLTNQVSSWMGSVKGDTEEKVPTPTEDNNALLGPESKEEGPTKASGSSGSSRLEMFSNVKNQIEGIGGWLGSSIPKLRKADTEPGNPEAVGFENAGADTGSPVNTDVVKEAKEDDDNSRNFSATGGADSGPQSLAESPTDENKDGQFGNVQSKALAGAKSIGNFLYTAVNKAGKTVTEAGSKIHVINANVLANVGANVNMNILGEFNKEQENFMKNKANSSASALPPWAGCANEECLKEDCLSLSTDKRNFVRAPPAGVNFQFDYESSYPVAMAIMEQDPNLEKMRYELVPKVIPEEEFWKNYFYRVSLICQENERSFTKRENSQVASDISSVQPIVDDRNSKNQKEHEFVSDSLVVSKEDITEVEEGMKKLVLGSKSFQEEDWEKELEEELQDYHVINDPMSGNIDRELEDILNEEADLK
ncbi:synapse-associated protein of 47 kDa isoform X3 [Anthonomus grandis grandis]|uniref:synapse-associated protein of 47 kDa isoform X3 n=1 Tax=Anthonomus grandis grandis TaxID=2921223 RepID=UPI0021659D57|nr:synapse-associated protein of 47 kDa isoform X3 [Anthonomus grandis grandis]